MSLLISKYRNKLSIRIPVLDILKTSTPGKNLALYLFHLFLSTIFYFKDSHHSIFNICGLIGICISVVVAIVITMNILCVLNSKPGREHIKSFYNDTKFIEKIISLIFIISLVLFWWKVAFLITSLFLLFIGWPKAKKLEINTSLENFAEYLEKIGDKFKEIFEKSSITIYIFSRLIPFLAVLSVSIYALFRLYAFSIDFAEGKISITPELKLISIGLSLCSLFLAAYFLSRQKKGVRNF